MVLLGPEPLLIAQGLTESLAGRFETITLPHWSLTEMRAAFGVSLDEYLYYGGYPGAAPLIGDAARSRGSSPKLQVLNTALMTAMSGLAPGAARADREFRGRLVESAVGAHLANAEAQGACRVYYWASATTRWTSSSAPDRNSVPSR